MTHFREDPQHNGLGVLLGQVCRLVGHRRRVRMESIGLYHAQGQILHRLWQDEGIAQVELARDLQISPPTATSTLKRMERDGWIKRMRDESDQRIVRVYPTDRAKRLRKEVRDSFRELEKEMTAMLSSKEQETLRKSLIKVHRYLSEKYSDDHEVSSGRHAAKKRGKRTSANRGREQER